jgi:hypothetical protein
MTNAAFVPTRKPSNIFFYCYVARFVLSVFTMSFGLQPPTDVENLFGMWLQHTSQHIRSLIYVASAILWLFGFVEMMQFLTKKKITRTCRLFSGLFMGLVSETSCKRRATNHL